MDSNTKRKPEPITETPSQRLQDSNTQSRHHHQYEEDALSGFQKIKTVIYLNSTTASQIVAQDIAQLIKERQKEGQNVVLGLATGSTPQSVYAELIRLHQEQGLSFKNVITFNLDEYYPLEKENIQSYNFYMRDNLFNHIDIDMQNVNIPDGTVAESELHEYCLDYEDQIIQAGGIDLQLLGIGRDGHIGFNEPGSSIRSITRKVTLEKITRVDAASSFLSLDKVPKNAITMGIDTILNAQKIIIMAFSQGKAQIVQQAIQGPVTSDCPSSFLQNHPNTWFYLDNASAQKLTRTTTPWLIRGVETPTIVYNDEMTKKAVAWLSNKTGKPILRLVEHDYEENGLLHLVDSKGKGSAEKLNLQAFQLFMKTLTGWPAGGKPEQNEECQSPAYFNKKSINCKKILIFSPHPDDDVICMGSTMQKLVNQGHDVHVAYQVSGNIAVFDHDAERFIDYLKEFSQEFNVEESKLPSITEELMKTLKNRKIGEPDNEQILKIKGLIRRTESRVAAITTGVKRENILHLDLPFYESGQIQQNQIGSADVNIVKDLIYKLKPDQVYAAGDLTDPHGTHRVCLQVILKAIDEINAKTPDFLQETNFLMYRGAWQEWDIENVSLAVPISPEEIIIQQHAIFRHQSQRQAMFPGSDVREFWQRALERNRKTAELYKNLGFTSYEGVECFASLEWLRKHSSL